MRILNTKQSARHQRHGITLLFVVSMIVLFLLMGTAFVVVSSDFLRSAKKRARADNFEIDSTALLDRAFYDLVREPDLSDANSPLRGHSLLGDMYGYGFSAPIATAVLNDSKQFLTLRLDFSESRNLLDGSTYQPSNVSSLAGLVLSFTSGPAQGLATRIVDHQVTGSGSSAAHTFFVQPDWRDLDFDFSKISELVGTDVIVNGRPFAGTGAGNFDPQTPLNRPALSDTALQPNQSGRSLKDLLGHTGNGYLSQGSSTQSAHPASTNESYDTFDYQNMFLAGINQDGSVHVPSFHRAELVANHPIRSDFRAFKTGGANNDGVVVDNDNEGQPDGVWIDIGLPSQATAGGTHFKPLVSYTVVDLDGRINVNAHGNLYDAGQQMTEIDLLGPPTTAPEYLHRGAGYGPPEITMRYVLSTVGPKMFERYGADGLPGEPNVRDGWSDYKLLGYPNEPLNANVEGTVGGVFGTAMDVHGRFAIGYPNDIREFADGTLPIGMPVANVSESMLSSEIVDSAYEMSFAGRTMLGPDGRGTDQPFTPFDLEGVLRRADPDSNLLSDRLWNLGSGAFNGGKSARNLITTDSFEVPTTPENLSLKLARILTAGGVAADKLTEQIQMLLPGEVLRGLPMNVNRPFGDGIDNNNNGLIDEIGETMTVTHPNGEEFTSDPSTARFNFARHLYIITLLATEQVDRNGDGAINNSDWFDFNDDGQTDNLDRLDYRKMVAQWAINAVDFRDRDAINSPFEVDLNPWDGWDVDNNITTDEPSLGPLRRLLWGLERPEMLLTETLATHDRRTQDLKIDPTGDNLDDGDDDFDSHLVPAASAFFELYNPWVVNDANQQRPVELYDENLDGIDLQKKSLDGSSPVWRLVVTDHEQADLDPDDATNNPTTGGAPPVHRTATLTRRIYFARPSHIVDSGDEVFFPDPNLKINSLVPGLYAIVGSAGIQNGDEFVTYFGRRATAEPLNELDQTRRISLNPKTNQFQLAYWDTDKNEVAIQKRNAVNIPIGFNEKVGARNLGVSDPLAGYLGLTDNGININVDPVADGLKFTEDDTAPDTDFAFDEPVDRKRDAAHYDKYLQNDGLQPGYRTVHLQRLANPQRRFHPQTNPYLTIDSSAIDLFVFNGVEPQDDPNNKTLDLRRFGSFERQSGLDENGDPAVNGQFKDDTEKINRQRLLFKNDRLGHLHPSEEESKEIPQDMHIFQQNLFASLGGVNQAYLDANEIPDLPFAWVAWNNRPFASQLELANVPFTTSYWLPRLFNSADNRRDVYAPPVETVAETEARNYTAQFPHLLNFFADELADGKAAAGLHRVFDFLEVPSRFVGTESYVNPATFADDNRHGLSFSLTPPFDTLSNYRYPGKLNINTILNARVWNGLMKSYAVSQGIAGDDLLSYSEWEESRDGEGTLPAARLKFANPYRSPLAANWVPSNGLRVDRPADCGLFRSDGNGQPLFDYRPDPQQRYNDSDRGAFFRNDKRQRLGNLVTTRSSVFAIWITIGYFEMNADGSLRDASSGGFEVGSDSGAVRRARAFYIFDRSIPVAFEPGKNHNVDRAVLVRSLIE